MKIARFLSLSFLVLAMAATAFAQADAKKDQEKLQGTWKVEKLEVGGTALPAELTSMMTFVIKGDKMTELEKEKTENVSSFKLDPSKKPKTIDLVNLQGEEKGKKIPGIYEITGDTLKLCIGEKERPTDFKSAGSKTTALFIMKRAKK